MSKTITHPGGDWGLHARGWYRALKAHNKSDNTARIYVYAVRQLGDWALAQPSRSKPTTSHRTTSTSSRHN
ncbi:hypothetical protein [Saccharothrix australiensis]|uniref:hypothetical protein n=1 Tax=Saccharothrix australiensis TaxID=2072 RepID=UPI001FE4552B|nr:hypothetical protein [Saccharothrix australiensis]